MHGTDKVRDKQVLTLKPCHTCGPTKLNFQILMYDTASPEIMQDQSNHQSAHHFPVAASGASSTGDVFDMLSHALSDRQHTEYASVAPSRASSTAGPFKVNSMKLHHEEPPLVDLNPAHEQQPQHRKRVVKAASYNTRGGRMNTALPPPKAISLPNDHGLQGPGGGRQGRFTLEGVKEEQPSSFQSPYPQNDTTPETCAPAATPAAAESPAPRKWSLLRMFAMQKKEAAAVPANAVDGEPGSDLLLQPCTAAGTNSAAVGRTEMGAVRPSLNPRLAASMPRHGKQTLHSEGRRPSYNPRDASASVHSGSQTRGTLVPPTYPGTASSTGTNWQTPQSELHTPSAYITPVPLNPTRRIPAQRPKDMLQAAQQATPEQARAMLQKFSSIRSQQRRNSQVMGY